MKISPQGVDLIMQREGKRNDVYLDTRGIPTVGVGHTGPDVRMGYSWTDAQIEAALAKDLAWVESALDLVTVPIKQNQADALGSFIFNIGYGAWHGSTMLRLLNAGSSVDEVAAQFDRWHLPPEITPRRNGEKAQFLGTRFEARI